MTIGQLPATDNLESESPSKVARAFYFFIIALMVDPNLAMVNLCERGFVAPRKPTKLHVIAFAT